jgi:FtsZ-binding cell division protein ZapB
MAQVNAVKANLEPRVEQAQKDIDALEGRMTTAESDITTLKQDVADIKEDIAELDTRVGDLEEATEDLQKRMNTVEDRINAIVEALKNMVTSVTVNATSTSILQNSKLFPGLNLQFLGTAMGKAEVTGKFPSTTTMSGHGTALEAADFAGVDQYDFEAGQILPKADEETELADAGTVWFTLNPSNVDANNLKSLKLVDSQGNASFVSIDKNNVEKDTTTVLSWGYTRAEEFKPVLWKAQAGIELEATDLATIAPAEIIDYKAVASDVRAILSEIKAAAEDANRSNYADLAKTTTKSVLKSSAQIVASLLQAKVPALPALALEAQWEDTVGVRSVLSDYSIAATAYKPLSFSFGKDLIDGRTVSFDKLDNAFARIINKLKAKVPANFANVNISFDFTGVNKNITLYTNVTYDAGSNISDISISTTATGTVVNVLPALPSASTTYSVKGLVNLSGTIDPVINAVEAGVNVAQINNMINEVNKLMAEANSYADRSKSFEQRVSNFLEKELNRVISKVATDGFTRVLEPIILFQLNDNYAVSRFFNGTTLPAGKVDLIPTTMTYELLAPAYKKYVAVKKADGSFAFQKVLTKGDKDFNKVTVDLAAGNYTVIYSALDFSGKQIAKKYDVVVK